MLKLHSDQKFAKLKYFVVGVSICKLNLYVPWKDSTSKLVFYMHFYIIVTCMI